MNGPRDFPNRWSSHSRALTTGLRWLLAGVLGYVAYSRINYASLSPSPIPFFDVLASCAVAFVLGIVVSTFVVKNWILAPLALIGLQALIAFPGLAFGGDGTLWPIGLLLVVAWLTAAGAGSVVGSAVRWIGRLPRESRS